MPLAIIMTITVMIVAMRATKIVNTHSERSLKHKG